MACLLHMHTGGRVILHIIISMLAMRVRAIRCWQCACVQSGVGNARVCNQVLAMRVCNQVLAMRVCEIGCWQ